VGWHGLVRSRIRYPLLANAVQRLLTVWRDKTVRRQNRLQQAKWELTSRIRDESNVPNAFHFYPCELPREQLSATAAIKLTTMMRSRLLPARVTKPLLSR
jgi:hypothetical protein